MKRLIPAPVVAATLSGFVVGVILTLIATGAASHTAATPVATLPPATPVPDAQLYTRIHRIVVRELGVSYPNSKQPRLVSLTLNPAAIELVPHEPHPHDIARYRSVSIIFRLNDHPLGHVWRLRAAKADVFSVMKALYTSQLPVYSVEMIGIFPIQAGKATRTETSVVAFMDHDVAATIPWKVWGRDKEGRVWTLLAYQYVNPRFA